MIKIDMTKASIIFKLLWLAMLIILLSTAPNIVGRIEVAKRPMTLPQEHEAPLPSAKIRNTTPAQTKCKIFNLPYQNVTADVGQFETMEGAQRDLAKLKGYLIDCSEDFCKDLANKASIQKAGWPGDPEHSTYFLTVGNIDEPTFYALCDYMWNTEGAWARQTYHRCTDFDHKDNP